jgi:hypothetical protein
MSVHDAPPSALAYSLFPAAPLPNAYRYHADPAPSPSAICCVSVSAVDACAKLAP